MNIFHSWIDASLSIRLTLTLGHFLWQGLAVALAAGALITVLRRASAQARYGVLVIALAAMAASPLLTFCVVAVPAAPAPQPLEQVVQGTAFDEVPPSLPSPEFGPEIIHPSQASVEAASDVSPPNYKPSVSSSASPIELPIDWWRFAPLATAAYLAGVLVLLIRLILGLHGGRRLCLRSEPVVDRAVLDEVARQVRSLGLRFTPAVAWCEKVAVPVVVGVVRPTILLPLSLATGLAPDQVAAILTHELAHIRRYDHLVDLAQRLIEAFLFFHPAVWWLSRRIRIEREHCCDDLVVSLGVTPIHYSESLLRVAELSRLQPGYEPVPGIVGLYATTRPSRLRQRIARLLGGPVESHVRFGHGWTLTLAIMLASAVAAPFVMMLHADPPADRIRDERSEPATGNQQVATEKTTQLGPFQLVATLGDNRLRHWNYIHAIAYSPDGDKIATASRDHTVTVWDGATGRDCWTATGAGWMNCVAFSPDGKWLATGGEARVKRGSAVQIVRGNSRLFTGESERGGSPVKVWEVETGRELCSLDMRGGGSSALRLAFGPDGRTLVVAGSGEIEIWDVQSANRLRFMQGHTDENRGFAIWALALSPNGLTLATGATDHKIKLWNISTGEELRTIEGHVMPITVLRFSADGKRLFSGSQDDQLKTWNVETGVEIGNLQVGRATFLSLTSDEKQLITADDQGKVRVWDFATGKENRTIELVRGFSPSYALSPDRRTLAWSQSESLHFLDLESATVRPVSVPSSSQYWGARFSPDGELLALGNRDGTVDVCKTGTWEKIRTLRGHSKWVSSVDISPDGKTLAAVGDEDGKVAVWDLASGAHRGEITVHERTFPIAFAPDGKWVATGSVKGVVQLWDIVAGIALTLTDVGDTIPKDHTRAVRGLAFSADGETLVSCYYDLVKVWDVAGRREIKALQRPLRSHTNETRRGLVRCVAVSPDGKTVAAGDSERVISVWDLQTDGVTLLEGHARDVTALQFTPDGATLISGSEDGTLRLWDLRTRQLAETIAIGPPEGRVGGLALNPSGDQVAVVTGAGTVQILSWPGKLSSEQLQKLKPATPVLWGKASPNGMQLALVLDPRRDVYWLGEVVKARLILRNATQKEIEFTAPRLEVLEKLGFELTLADDHGKVLAWQWGQAHKSENDFSVSGGVGVRMKPGETYQLAEAKLLVGGDANPANVIAKLNVDVGQHCRLACKLVTYAHAKDEGEPLQSGTIEFRVVDGGLPGHESFSQEHAIGRTTPADGVTRIEPSKPQLQTERFATDVENGWGEEKDSLRTRLVMITEKPTVGQPLRFRLEMKNFGKLERHYDPQNAAAFRVMSVKKVDGEADPYIGPSYQTAGGPKPIKPGETVVLWDDYDAAEQFLLAEPGKYVVETRGARAIPAPPVPGVREPAESAIPPSNAVTVELAPGKLPELKAMFVRMREVLPKEKAWRISMSSSVIFFTHAPTNLKKDVTTIQLWFDEKEHPPGYSLGEGASKVPVERLGKTPLGFAYLTAPEKAKELWPEFRDRIRSGLREPQEKSDQAALQGTWIRVSTEMNGKLIPVKPGEAPELVIRDDLFGFGGLTAEGELVGPERFRLDPNASPKQIDLTPLSERAGPLRDKTYYGIYELEGDKLTVCLHIRHPSQRPERFSTVDDQRFVIDVYQRKKAEEAKQREESDLPLSKLRLRLTSADQSESLEYEMLANLKPAELAILKNGLKETIEKMGGEVAAMITADESVPYDSVRRLVEVVNAAGAKKVSFAEGPDDRPTVYTSSRGNRKAAQPDEEPRRQGRWQLVIPEELSLHDYARAIDDHRMKLAIETDGAWLLISNVWDTKPRVERRDKFDERWLHFTPHDGRTRPVDRALVRKAGVSVSDEQEIRLVSTFEMEQLLARLERDYLNMAKNHTDLRVVQRTRFVLVKRGSGFDFNVEGQEYFGEGADQKDDKEQPADIPDKQGGPNQQEREAAIVSALERRIKDTARKQEELRDQMKRPWTARGQVTDADGEPMPVVAVRAHCGAGSLHMTGETTTDADGRYELRFGPGIFMAKENKSQLQAATISVHKPGYFERNLHRQGDRLAAYTLEGVEFPVWGKKDKDAVFLPGEPKEINFVMLPTAKASGTLVDAKGKPLSGYRMSLTGPELPPSSSALASGGKTDENGRFEFRDIPTGYRFQIMIEPPNAEPPWVGWAVAPLEFRGPGKADLIAVRGGLELAATRFELVLAAEGSNWRNALKQAAESKMISYRGENLLEHREGDHVRVSAATLRLILGTTIDRPHR